MTDERRNGTVLSASFPAETCTSAACGLSRLDSTQTRLRYDWKFRCIDSACQSAPSIAGVCQNALTPCESADYLETKLAIPAPGHIDSLDEGA
jgi:hypothetical protein